jgi:XTP/dITP diphosphohydrolase
VPDEHRQAHFACAAALALPDGTEKVWFGQMPGRLIREPRGSNGFGYDPILVPDGQDRTSAELSPEEKNAISHRGKAFRALAADLTAFLK